MSNKEITYRVYYDDCFCMIFNSLRAAKSFIKNHPIQHWEIIKYIFHNSYTPWQEAIKICNEEGDVR